VRDEMALVPGTDAVMILLERLVRDKAPIVASG
jgi:hypothetical protein